MIQKQDAVQMIDFMFESASHQFFALEFYRFAFCILGAYLDFTRARDGFTETGNAQAAFFARLLAFAKRDFRINDDDLFRLVFANARIDDGDAQC